MHPVLENFPIFKISSAAEAHAACWLRSRHGSHSGVFYSPILADRIFFLVRENKFNRQFFKCNKLAECSLHCAGVRMSNGATQSPSELTLAFLTRKPS